MRKEIFLMAQENGWLDMWDPLERLSWLQRQSEEAEVVIVREADLAELEAEVVRLREEREELLDQLATAMKMDRAELDEVREVG